MTQFQFDLINALIERGVPAFADELREAIVNLVQAHNELLAENDQLKRQLTQVSPVESSIEEVIIGDVE